MIKQCFCRVIAGVLPLVSAVLIGPVVNSAFAHDEPVKNPEEWDIGVRFGFNYNSGNTDTNLIDLGFRANREFSDNILTFEGAHRFGENQSETNVDDSRLRGDYKRLLTDRMYLGFGTEWNRDEIADVKYRVMLEPKLGYFIVKEDDLAFSVETGPGYVFEDVGGVTDDYFSPFVGERVDWAVSESAKLFEEAKVNFDIDDADNYLVKATAGIETTVTGSVSLIVGVTYDYDNLPALGREKEDVAVITALNFAL